jgi:hypothetical protein
MPKFIAQFSDGFILRRQTSSTYTHAWHIAWCWTRPRPWHDSRSGFAKSVDDATDIVNSLRERLHSMPDCTITACEITEAELFDQ